jgi:hypothetical protein
MVATMLLFAGCRAVWDQGWVTCVPIFSFFFFFFFSSSSFSTMSDDKSQNKVP